ncbi:MAG: pantoate--beta-alanine ligase [Candidatus Omnitrophota bacterium]|jgi:pantoate--beta-alanine ligase
MRIIRRIKDMHRLSSDLRKRRRTIGFVPTMGALHDGHLSLIRQARRENNFVIVSIFVNPTQFAPSEDFNKYPRKLKVDSRLCKNEGVDAIFYPDVQEMYPKEHKTYVLVEGLSDVLCGKYRPGHFRGVATVVTKLFNIIQPDIAYFGQKDAQQAIIIQQMIQDLNLPLRIRVSPIIREPDGLALSSRNAYLTARQRRAAVVLPEALRKARIMVKQRVTDSAKIIRLMHRIIKREKAARIQYIEIVDLNELKPVRLIKDKVLVALAVWIGRTRLIDNIIVKPPKG